MELPIIKKSNQMQVDCIEKSRENNIFSYQITLKADDTIKETQPVDLTWKMPFLDGMGIWHPRCGFNRSIGADWDSFHKSMTASSAPICCIFSEEGENRFALAVSETKEIIHIRAGIHEEDGTLLLQVQIPASYFVQKGTHVIDVRIDTGKKPFYKAIQEVALWWEEDCGIKPIIAPDVAKEPVYSTWYSYHQDLKAEEIEEECKLAADLGFCTVILDDGWQTDDNNRGYAFCGDWEVSKNRFPDFEGHIQKIHDMGMNYMIWYSVPFLGRRSQKWNEFKDKLLFYNDSTYIEAGVLDPRYKEVREYLANIYADAMKEWKIDGLKLDFIDSIYAREDSPDYQPDKMDYESVQEALDCLMLTVYERVSNQKEEVMVEFRQSYIGPNMRRYGNMFRVSDCPNSALSNRVGVVDLRMMSGQTAVHSDPLMWHKDESPELAAIQIISSVFSTPQISVKLGNMTAGMNSMLKFWMSFVKENKTLLQDVPICALEPQNLYPVVWTQKETKAIMAVYGEERILKLPEGAKEVIILNGTKGKRIVLDAGINKQMLNANFVVKDCCGRIIEEPVIDKEGGLYIIKVPISGLVYCTLE